MPHGHSTTEVYTRRIEDTIEQLLRRGDEINTAMQKELPKARRIRYIPEMAAACSRTAISSSRQSASKRTVSAAASTVSSRASSTPIMRVQGASLIQVAKNQLKPSRSLTVPVSLPLIEKLVDGETSVEMRSFPVSAASSRLSHSSVCLHKVQQTSLFKAEEKTPGWVKHYQHETSQLLKGKTGGGEEEEECSIRTRVFSPTDPKNKWMRVNEVWSDSHGRQMLNVWAELLGEKTRNVWVNGRQVKE